MRARSLVALIFVAACSNGGNKNPPQGSATTASTSTSTSTSTPPPAPAPAPTPTPTPTPTPAPVTGNPRMAIDGNQPFDSNGNLGFDAALVAETGTRWCRVNFIGNPWTGPTDTTRYQGRTWGEAHDLVVDSLRTRNVDVYGLLNDQLTGGGDFLRDQSDPAKARQWVEDFAAACEVVVGRFKDRVRVFEVLNEPNDWGGGTNARVSAFWQALILKRVHERVKLDHAADPTWQVTLVSGPLFSFSGTNGDDYLREVYQAGKASHDWAGVRSRGGRYPLDGIGYHIYELEGQSDRPDQVVAVYKRHLDAIDAVVKAEDPEHAQKKIWVSEFGWRSNWGEQHQADMLDAGFTALLADSRVALAVYFCLREFLPDGYALTDGTHKRAAFFRFQQVVKR